MKKAINQKEKNSEINSKLSDSIYKLAKLVIQVGVDSPMFMELVNIQCELIRLQKEI